MGENAENGAGSVTSVVSSILRSVMTKRVSSAHKAVCWEEREATTRTCQNRSKRLCM